MIEIPLTKGFVALVDDEDADLAQLKWCAKNSGYAARRPEGVRSQPQQYMHRVILERMLSRPLAPGEITDHIDGDRWNNRRFNLRLATNTENCCNRGKSPRNTSGHKGVSFHKRAQKWRAVISFQRKYYELGLFDTPEAAAEAYKEAAIRLHGQFARFD